MIRLTPDEQGRGITIDSMQDAHLRLSLMSEACNQAIGLSILHEIKWVVKALEWEKESTWSAIPNPLIVNAITKTGNGGAGDWSAYAIIWRIDPRHSNVEQRTVYAATVDVPNIMVYFPQTASTAKSLQINACTHLSKSKPMREVHISKSSQYKTL